MTLSLSASRRQNSLRLDTAFHLRDADDDDGDADDDNGDADDDNALHELFSICGTQMATMTQMATIQ